MRTWGRISDAAGNLSWAEVTTDVNGNNDLVYITTLAQVIRLQPNESPLHADYGIPSLASVQQIVPPDIYMARTQQQFAPYFASLIISRGASVPGRKGHSPSPSYTVSVITHTGAVLPPATVPLQGYSENIPT